MASWLFDEPCTCDQISNLMNEAPAKPVTIVCNFYCTYDGQLSVNERLAISGSCEELGEWKLDDVVVLAATPDKKMHYAKVPIPRDTDIEYRYLIVACNPVKYGVIVRRWESHAAPRIVYNKLKQADEFGRNDGERHVARGWLSTEQYVQFKIFNGPIHYRKRVPQRLLYIKVVPLCAIEPFEKGPEPDLLKRKNFSLGQSCDATEFAIVEAACFSDDQLLAPQTRCGMRCGPQDVVLYHVTVLEPKYTIFRFDVYSMECGDNDSAKDCPAEPCYIGYGRLEPDDFNGSSGTFKLGIVCAQTHKTIMYICVGYLIIKPLPNFEHSLRTTYVRNWRHDRAMLEIGHRGCGKSFLCKENLVRENTINSFNYAAAKGAQMVEFDVMLTADGLPLVHHDHVLHLLRKPDADIKALRKQHDILVIPEKLFAIAELLEMAGRKTAKELHFSIEKFTKQQLRSMKALRFARMHEERISLVQLLREQLPFATLEEVFDSVCPELGFNIEIKWPQQCSDGQYEDEGFKSIYDINHYVDNILTIVLRKAGQRRILFTCFDCDICMLLRYKQNRYPVMQLTANPEKAVQYVDPRINVFVHTAHMANAMELCGIVVHANTFIENPSLVAYLRNRNLSSIAWGEPLRNAAMRRQMRMLGLQGIIYDRIDSPDSTSEPIKSPLYILESFLNRNEVAKLQLKEVKERCGYGKKDEPCVDEIEC